MGNFHHDGVGPAKMASKLSLYSDNKVAMTVGGVPVRCAYREQRKTGEMWKIPRSRGIELYNIQFDGSEYQKFSQQFSSSTVQR